jgi:CHAT domain-containing protein|tara:strand:+ start:2027 stop:2443 length:417 start_codon:yes stop_codon:yes gene_type:complete
MPYKSFAFYLKNLIIKHNTDLSSLESQELHQWLISNFATILSHQEIFINTISLTPIKDEFYKCLFLIEAMDGDMKYTIEYGELLNLDAIDIRLAPNNISRLSLLNFEDNKINLSKLNSSDHNDYTLIKSKERKTLIIY